MSERERAIMGERERIVRERHLRRFAAYSLAVKSYLEHQQVSGLLFIFSSKSSPYFTLNKEKNFAHKNILNE